MEESTVPGLRAQRGLRASARDEHCESKVDVVIEYRTTTKAEQKLDDECGCLMRMKAVFSWVLLRLNW